MNTETAIALELLQPGDIILQHSPSNPISERIRKFDRGNYSHARIYCGKNEEGLQETIEIGFNGVGKIGLTEGFELFKAGYFRVFRHKNIYKNPTLATRIIEKAMNYQRSETKYASVNQITLLANILVLDTVVQYFPAPELLRKIYEKAIHLFIRNRSDGKKMFTCSGFIFQVFEDSLAKIKIERFKSAKNTRFQVKESNMYLNQIVEKRIIEDEDFLKYLFNNNLIAEEISDEDYLKILNQIEIPLLSYAEDYNENQRNASFYKRGNTSNIDDNTEIDKTLFSLNFLRALQKKRKPLPSKLNDDGLEPTLIETLVEHVTARFDNYKDHTFFSPADLALSPSLDTVTDIISLE